MPQVTAKYRDRTTAEGTGKMNMDEKTTKNAI